MRFIRFVAVGAINTGITFLLYLLLLAFVEYRVAYTIAFVSGIAISYVLNSTFVFPGRGDAVALMRFPLVYLVQYACGWALLTVLVARLGVGEIMAMGIVVGVTVVLTYVLMTWVFAPRPLPAARTIRRKDA